MKTKTAVVAGAALTLAAVACALVLWESLPRQIPTHWNARGQVDGWGDKSWAAFALPGTMALFVALTVVLPSLSPRDFAIEAFRGTFNWLMLVVVAMFGVLHVLSLLAALNPQFDSGRAVMASVFVFLALIGNALGKVRRNFWMGVRTPWTLASDEVWISTHRLAARLLVAAGLGGAVALALGAPVGPCLLALGVASVVPVAHSLLLFKRLEREESA